MSISRSSFKDVNIGAKKIGVDGDTSNISLLENKNLDKKTLDRNIDNIFHKSATDSFIKSNNLNVNNSNNVCINKADKNPVKLINHNKTKKNYLKNWLWLHFYLKTWN